MNISLTQLLEAGCHFGHKAERWHPKSASNIFAKKDGIHIIDLAQTKKGLEEAGVYIQSVVKNGGEVLFVGTKRQAKEAVREFATEAGAPFLAHRWIGGFLTNWESVKKNIDRIISMETGRDSGAWKQYPKHEQVKMGRYLSRIKLYYEGVLKLTKIPDAIVILDIKRERSVVKEADRTGVVSIGIVDTNSDPTLVAHAIPANDDALGSIRILLQYLTGCYKEAKNKKEKDMQKGVTVSQKIPTSNKEGSVSKPKAQEKPEVIVSETKTVSKPEIKGKKPAEKKEIKKKKTVTKK